MKAKRWVVQCLRDGRWRRSHNDGAEGVYTRAEAERLAKLQEKQTYVGLTYRAKEIK